MKESIVIEVIRNIIMLLIFCILYDYFWVNRAKGKTILFKILAGVFISVAVIVLIVTPSNYISGVLFDTRSVVFAISGLFLGPIPTLTAILISSIYRYYEGGSGIFMGISVIFSSGIIGILWNYVRPRWQTGNSFFELLFFGLVVHLAMLACTLLLPQELILPTFKSIFFSVIILYPLATIMLGKYILLQNKNRNNKKALEESESRWQFALEGAEEGIWDWNPQTNEIFYSKQWKKILGYDENEIENKFDEWEKRVHPEDLPKLNELIKQHIEGEIPYFSIEYRMFGKNGSYKWLHDKGKIMQYDAAGKPLRFIGTHKDISSNKETELLLAKERFLLESLMNSAPECIFFKDLNSKFIRLNPVAAHKLGVENVNDAIGKSDFDFFDSDYATNSYYTEQEIIKTGKAIQSDEVSTIHDGTVVWSILNKMPLYDLDNQIAGTYALAIDITERKKAEHALKDSEQYTNSILMAIPDLIFILDSNAVILDCRTGAENELIMPVEQFLNKKVYDLMPVDLSVKIKNAISLTLKNQQKEMIEYELQVQQSLNSYECNFLPFQENKVIAVVHNITKRKKIEAELIHSRNQLKNFAAHLQNIREEERLLQAQEIHDELGQILIALKIDMGMLKQTILKEIKEPALEKVSMQLEKPYSLLNDLINTVRKIMTGLHPELIELAGFCEAARIYVNDYVAKTGINCKFDCPVSEINLEPQKSIALFRILQEALSNTAKHAKATKATVRISVEKDRIVLKVSDNGIGFDDSKVERSDSYGFMGMTERAYLLDGKLTVSGNPGKGAVVLFEMPYLVNNVQR